MEFYNWLVVLLPVAAIIGMSIYCRRYIRDVADYLSAGRVARRYVICVGGMEEALGVLTLMQMMERNYLTGFAITFWQSALIVVTMVLSLTGYCIYRFRETRSMTLGQFLEMRYNRPLRVFASVLHNVADLLTEIILPALAARFFIYFFDLPAYFSIGGFQISTYVAVMLLTMSIALTIVLTGGAVALLVSDCIQGLICYPLFLIIVVFALCKFSWSDEILPVMFDRVGGESFLNPFDIENMRNFNIFMIFTAICTRIMNHAIWIGSGFATSAKSAHEQKIASVLGTWRTGFSQLMIVLIGIMLIVMMNHRDFSDMAKTTRIRLSGKVAAEVMPKELLNEFNARIDIIETQTQQIGIDTQISQKQNIDTPYIDAAEATMKKTADSNQNTQKFRTLYQQLLFPVAMRTLLPPWMHGLFILLIVMIMISTDTSRILMISSCMAQDLVLPFLKKPMQTKHQLWLIRSFAVLVAAIFFFGSLLMDQIEYIQLFVVIVGAVWTGGAGAVMVFGLYSRFGTTAGAFASLIGGSVFSVSGMLISRNWADVVYPWLERRNMIPALSRFLETASAPLNPYVVWKMNAQKFPINAYEILFMSLILSSVLYVMVSLLTYRKPFNLERMLHRGKYADEQSKPPIRIAWSLKNVFSKLIGINPEYTKSDRAIAYSVFTYTFIYRFGLTFVLVLICNIFFPWSKNAWGKYWFITMIAVPFAVGLITTVWFFIGGMIDLRHLFRDLEARKRDYSDDGRVEKLDD